MNRIDRLFAILLALQTRRKVRAEDLARHFEISKRTVYRDIIALSEMGVPVVSLPGEGYSLMDGYFLPPLLFSVEEAAALVLGAKLLAGQASGDLPRQATDAVAKITHVLPTTTQLEIEHLSQIIQFYLARNTFNLNEPALAMLQRAIREEHPVQLRYNGRYAEGVTERVVEPHYLTYADGVWYVNGYCRLRQGMRAFRLSRIENCRLLQEHFTRRRVEEPQVSLLEVQVQFAPEDVRWVEERQHYAFARREGCVMWYLVHDLREIQSWLFGWGTRAEVLAPPALRAAIREEAKKLTEMLT
jgi:predicted DNA-binding transcriptional regulator YafY